MTHAVVKDMTLEEFRKYCIKTETNVEGGYVNDPKDLGGETNHGITVGTANAYKSALVKLFDWNGKMIDLTDEMAYYIYEEEFWHNMQLDQMFPYSMTITQTMFRWGLKSGSKRPVSSLQESLNVLNNEEQHYKDIVVDGWIGPKTRGALDGLIKRRGKDAAKSVIAYMINCDQTAWMKTISVSRETNQRFTWGWVTRCMHENVEYVERHGLPKV